MLDVLKTVLPVGRVSALELSIYHWFTQTMCVFEPRSCLLLSLRT